MSSKKDWIRFFRNAGVYPASDVAKYAKTFVKHRIKNDMLGELNEFHLNEMGITIMGDVIRILRHSKHVHEEIKTKISVPNGSKKIQENKGTSGLATGYSKLKEMCREIILDDDSREFLLFLVEVLIMVVCFKVVHVLYLLYHGETEEFYSYFSKIKKMLCLDWFFFS
ncbi:uncharacterized protein C19orf47 homolog isoform X2 [Planococcus citri]|uniref:uncharacterized protein C19orf47 homolog isoform X2 n=1 Tax=Planococcus citri TaxID=170843 RepID=UPI0031F97298